MTKPDPAVDGWAAVLAHRSPEGAAMVAELRAAEATVVRINERMRAALAAGDLTGDMFAELGAAMEAADVLQAEVARLAKQ